MSLLPRCMTELENLKGKPQKINSLQAEPLSNKQNLINFILDRLKHRPQPGFHLLGG